MIRDASVLFTYSLAIVLATWLQMDFDFNFAGYGRQPKTEVQSKNNAPVVKITEPKNNSIHEPNALVRYSVMVSDIEDGESKFDEIPPNEVFLEVRYVDDASPLTYGNHKSPGDPPGLRAMKKSNCFTCHSLKSKLIGPSFHDISERYLHDPSAKQMLAGKITGGSMGVWGKAVMPAQPSLKQEEAFQIVDWILKNGADPDLDFYTGIGGTFRLTTPEPKPQGVFVITASYTDHGLKDKPELSKSGRDVVMIRIK